MGEDWINGPPSEKTYRVKVSRDAEGTQSAFVSVAARSEEEALENAISHVSFGGDTEWTWDKDATNADPPYAEDAVEER